jgi:hypothetical protein
MLNRFLVAATIALLCVTPMASVFAKEGLCSSGPCSKAEQRIAFLQRKTCGTDKNPAPRGTKCPPIGICNGINSDCCAENDAECMAGKR